MLVQISDNNQNNNRESKEYRESTNMCEDITLDDITNNRIDIMTKKLLTGMDVNCKLNNVLYYHIFDCIFYVANII